jgi:hypothetical protein
MSDIDGSIEKVAKKIDDKDMKALLDLGNIQDYLSLDFEEAVIPPKPTKSTTLEVLDSDKSKTASTINIMKVVYMTVQGFSNATIGEELGVTASDIITLKKTDDFMRLKDAVTQEVINAGRMFMAMGTIKAVRTLLQCMDSSNEKIKLMAATQVLDRVGLKTPEQIEILNKGNNLSKMNNEDLLKIIQMGNDDIKSVIVRDADDDEQQDTVGEESGS